MSTCRSNSRTDVMCDWICHRTWLSVACKGENLDDSHRKTELHGVTNELSNASTVRRLVSLTIVASLVFGLAAIWSLPAAALETGSLETALSVPAGANFYVAVDVDSTAVR